MRIIDSGMERWEGLKMEWMEGGRRQKGGEEVERKWNQARAKSGRMEG